MLGKGGSRPISVVADIAFPPGPVPGHICDRERGVDFMPPDLLVGDDAVRVTLANDVENALAIERGCSWAGASFKVVAQTIS